MISCVSRTNMLPKPVLLTFVPRTSLVFAAVNLASNLALASALRTLDPDVIALPSSLKGHRRGCCVFVAQAWPVATAIVLRHRRVEGLRLISVSRHRDCCVFVAEGSLEVSDLGLREKLPVVVLKAEEIMYSKANSEAEYLNPDTLRDRLNDLC
ncbi:hypothetical protein Fmac_011398 [Flemingia macrophylla]|uniref:Uncharacterized protein n=1 Tax=Flemingia macrophylla TaxID=520843 RepID=A0ABD1MMD2_9FABA